MGPGDVNGKRKKWKQSHYTLALLILLFVLIVAPSFPHALPALLEPLDDQIRPLAQLWPERPIGGTAIDLEHDAGERRREPDRKSVV